MKEGLQTPEKKTLTVSSSLENKEGGHSPISIKLENGMPKGLFFFDIDKTLVHIEEVYKPIRSKLWPELAERKGSSINEIHLDGFRLGTMWAEMLRMKHLNEGDDSLLELEKAEKYFDVGGKGYGIEKPEHPLHQEADEELQRFDILATQETNKVFQNDPGVFEKSKIKPVFHLLDMYRKLGIPMVGMSANPRNFIHTVCRYSGLSDYFLACGNDTDTKGMKEFKMADLITQLDAMGVPIPYDKLYIFGDSPNGDVGSGPRFEKLVETKHPEVDVHGILICGDETDYKKGQGKIIDPLFRESVKALRLDQVPQNAKGTPKMGEKHQELFLREL